MLPIFVISFSYSESVFIKSLQDVINFNSECHILLFIKQPFTYNIQIQAPSTIKTLNGKQKVKRTEKNRINSFISVMTIKGIDCVYAILVRVPERPLDKTNSSSEKRHHSDFFDILTSAQAVKCGISELLSFKLGNNYKPIDVNPMTHLLLFTAETRTYFQKHETELMKRIKFIMKIGIVLLEEQHFQDDHKPCSSKAMETFIC